MTWRSAGRGAAGATRGGDQQAQLRRAAIKQARPGFGQLPQLLRRACAAKIDQPGAQMHRLDRRIAGKGTGKTAKDRVAVGAGQGKGLPVDLKAGNPRGLTAQDPLGPPR
jgi:hypothetical protein